MKIRESKCSKCPAYTHSFPSDVTVQYSKSQNPVRPWWWLVEDVLWSRWRPVVVAMTTCRGPAHDQLWSRSRPAEVSATTPCRFYYWDAGFPAEKATDSFNTRKYSLKRDKTNKIIIWLTYAPGRSSCVRTTTEDVCS